MGVFWRVGGVVLRAAMVIGIWWAGDRANSGGPPSDDMSGVAVLAVITALAVFVWGVVDGIRERISRVAGTWLSTVLFLVLVLVALVLVVERSLGAVDLFLFMLVGGMLLFVVLLPALVGATLGAGLRRVTQWAS
jgi:hypothetical protein